MNMALNFRTALGLLCLIFPLVSQAWWSEDWAFRKEIKIDTSPTGGDIATPVNDAQVLVRLHAGNFGYFMDVQPKAEDIRFIDSDDKTPLKFHIERFDPINQIALIWVKLPQVQGGATTRSIWMYYSNATAVKAADMGGTYDAPQAVVLHFSDPQALGSDATAYGNNAQATDIKSSEGLIGGAASFEGKGGMTIPAGRGLLATAESGFTFSTWVKIDAEQTEALLIGWSGGGTENVALHLVGSTPRVRYTGSDGVPLEISSSVPLTLGQWQHLALVAASDGLSLYVNGALAGSLADVKPTLNGPLQIGAAADSSQGLVGQLDEVGIAATARSADWIRFAVHAQTPESKLLVYGEDGQQEGASGGESYFGTILRNVTLDGWVVIVLLVIMAALSWVVMASKGMVIARIRKDNAAFLQRFAQLGVQEVDKLDSDAAVSEEERDSSALLTALSGHHEHFQSSNVYRIYHAGVQELHHRALKSVGAQAVLFLTPQAVNALKATMDGVLVRELQKLNSQMVVLTIAISGGPFLGLLGTVVGVMITFAAIAASGDVNVNAIAPGIAAALVATVAGLGVAIPALFGYNYIGSRIKEVSADMHVFVDEFVAKIAEQHS